MQAQHTTLALCLSVFFGSVPGCIGQSGTNVGHAIWLDSAFRPIGADGCVAFSIVSSFVSAFGNKDGICSINTSMSDGDAVLRTT